MLPENDISIEGSILCPSTAPSESTHVLGIRRRGAFEFLIPPLPLPDVAQKVITLDNLQNKLRLTGPCVRQACGYWSGRCDLGTELATTVEPTSQDCPIYSRCRWQIENGQSACTNCLKILWHSGLGEIK
jgi:hypothetical protein